MNNPDNVDYVEDPGFLFEALGRAAFKCKKEGDPYHFAKQEVYDNFVGEITIRGKRALSSFLQKIINDNYPILKQSNEIISLIELEDNIWEIQNQDEAIDIIYESIEVARILGYDVTSKQ